MQNVNTHSKYGHTFWYNSYPSDKNVPLDGRNKTVRPNCIPIKIEYSVAYVLGMPHCNSPFSSSEIYLGKTEYTENLQFFIEFAS